MKRKVWIFILLILFSGCQYRETIEAPTSNLETTSNATTQVAQGAPNDEGFGANPLMLFSEMPLPTNKSMPPLILKTYYNSKNESHLTDLHIINTATEQSVGDFSFVNYADSWPDIQMDKETGDEYAEHAPDSVLGLLLEPYETSSYLS